MFAATQHIFTVQPVVLLSTALPTEPERGPHSRRTVGGGTESRERKEGGLFPSIPPTTRAVPPTLQANGGRRNGIQGKEGRGVISVHSSHDTSLPYRSKEAVIITTGRRRGGDKGHSRGAPMAPSAGAARGNNKSGGGPVPAAAQRTYVRVARHAFPGAPRGSLVGPCMRCRVCARQGTRAPPRLRVSSHASPSHTGTGKSGRPSHGALETGSGWRGSDFHAPDWPAPAVRCEGVRRVHLPDTRSLTGHWPL
jgi:hypothetical protein